MTIDVNAARTFIYGNARLLDQLLYAALFEDGPSGAVLSALIAYQNDDGGFGHGLEPDTRCPHSQPLDVEVAFEYLHAVGADAPTVVTPACDFLATVAEPGGAVPVLLPSIAAYPRAAHWAATDEYAPGLNPTAGIAAYVHALGVGHPWLDAATESCFAALESVGPSLEAHTLACATRLLEHAPDRERARSLAGRVADALRVSTGFQATPDAANYGLTPLEFAATPSSLAREWFEADTIESHLDDLERQQEPDGGWPITWQSASEASRLEWRAIRTLRALRVLSAYGRLG